MGKSLDSQPHASKSGDNGQTEARSALLKEFSGDLKQVPMYPAPPPRNGDPSVGDILQKGADRLHVDQRNSIGSTMSALKFANKWDPAMTIHLTAGGADHMKTLAKAGLFSEHHTTQPNNIGSGSLVFGKGLDGKMHSAIKGSGDNYFQIGDDMKWTKANAAHTFAKGQNLDVFTQSKSFSTLTDNQRQAILASTDSPSRYGNLNLGRKAPSLVDQLDRGVNAHRFTSQMGLNADALTSAGKPYDQFVSKDGSIRGRFSDEGKMQVWNHDIKMYHTLNATEQKAYGDKQFLLYHPVEKK
jgi:hypothetical protein